MTEAVVVALITGGMSLMGVVVTCLATARRTQKNQEINQAVMETELKELTREVRAHNHFAQRMPVVEREISLLHAQVRDLRAYHTPN